MDVHPREPRVAEKARQLFVVRCKEATQQLARLGIHRRRNFAVRVSAQLAPGARQVPVYHRLVAPEGGIRAPQRGDPLGAHRVQLRARGRREPQEIKGAHERRPRLRPVVLRPEDQQPITAKGPHPFGHKGRVEALEQLVGVIVDLFVRGRE
eukprot:2549652-Prymnesium_polylepis.3